MPPRTKACALCRRKRIKCDATLPSCNMCVRNGKVCPGPVDGPLIIDMTSQTVKRTNAGKKARPARKDTGKTSKAIVTKPVLSVASIAQPSTVNALQEAFFAKFVVYFASDKDLQNKMTWLHVLPSWTADGSNPALTLAVRATSLAHTAATYHDLPLLQEACTMYGKALQSHQVVLASNQNKITPRMVSTSIMLSMFEAMLSTNGDAYREHIYGAAKMFDIAIPLDCSDGVMCQLFFHIRTQMSFVYLTTLKSQHINVKKVLTETLKYSKLPVVQKLLTYVAQLAEVYLAELPVSDQNLKTFFNAKTEIINLYQNYQARGQRSNKPVSWKDEYGRTTYRDSYTTMAMSFFHAGHILISVLSYRLGAPYTDLEDHCEPILESSRILEEKKMGCSYMQMAMPLYLVALHGSVSQQDEAYKLFESWRTGGMAGISYLALETIPTRRDEEFYKDMMIQQAYSPEYMPIRSYVLEIESEYVT